MNQFEAYANQIDGELLPTSVTLMTIQARAQLEQMEKKIKALAHFCSSTLAPSMKGCAVSANKVVVEFPTAQKVFTQEDLRDYILMIGAKNGSNYLVNFTDDGSVSVEWS